MGAATDLAIRSIGVTLPPLFTLFWGIGGIGFVLFASAQSKRFHAEEMGASRPDVHGLLEEADIPAEAEALHDHRAGGDA